MNRVNAGKSLRSGPRRISLSVVSLGAEVRCCIGSSVSCRFKRTALISFQKSTSDPCGSLELFLLDVPLGRTLSFGGDARHLDAREDEGSSSRSVDQTDDPGAQAAIGKLVP